MQAGALRGRVADLEARLAAADDAARRSENVPALERRVAELQARVADADAQQAQHAATLAARDAAVEELNNLQAVMGELTYEAEAANRAQLDLHRATAQLLQAAEERATVERAAAEARQEVSRRTAEATELRLRCKSAEERAVALGDHALRLRSQLATAEARLSTLEAAALTPEDRRGVAETVVGLLTR